ncbi:hypothetical protein CYY_008620 [Polysphondylium violaceum]|uniref:Defective in cullin neddylation protein n=1 Tax=Polysphondylium violaceum TaxID=133409 RepID=A0A8J4UX58_9MYCE|nr:hypothetical protein CYY_008620 [Polysphondylium violaceum]
MARSKSSTNTTTTSRKRKNIEDKEEPSLKKPFTQAESLFNNYKDEVECIGPDGVVNFCKDLGFDCDSIHILILAWKMGASKQGYFTKGEFLKGFESLGCYDLTTLKQQLLSLSDKLKNDSPKFSELYKFSFAFASEVDSKKSIDIQAASSMLQLILPDGPHTVNFVEFLRTQQQYKSINRDQWLCFLEFSKTVKSDLSNYDESEAWPLLIDEFVEHVKESSIAVNKEFYTEKKDDRY